MFAHLTRPGDITAGDFWGIEKHKPKFDDDKGVSLVLLNTKTGHKTFSEVSEQFNCEASNTSEAMQRNLYMATPPSPRREQFWGEFRKKGYKYVARKYTTYGFRNRVKREIIKPILRRLGLFEYIIHLRRRP